MSAVLDLAPETHSVIAGVREIDRLVDTMLHTDPPPPTACASLVSDVDRLIRRATAWKLRLVAGAEESTVAAEQGYASTGARVAAQTRTTPRAAARDLHLAGTLEHACPSTGEALARGTLSAEHAGVVVNALAQLPNRLTPSQRDQVEDHLITRATRLDPDQLRREARRALATVEPDDHVVDDHENTLVQREEQAAHATCAFTFHDNADGTVTGHFTTTALAFAIVHKILDTMTAPRHNRGRDWKDAREHGGPIDHRQRRGDAFTTLLEHLPTDHLHHKTGATLVVHLRHDVLTEQLTAAALTDTAEAISAGEARRLACTAGIIPAVLGGLSLPLDLGRRDRLFTAAQSLALSTVHDTCAA